MAQVLLNILYFIIMFAVLLGILVLCRKFLFTKVKINKYIPLGISIAILIAQFFVKFNNVFANAGVTIVVVVFFAWFLEIQQTGGIVKRNEKKIVIKPKAKPNRIKHNNK